MNDNGKLNGIYSWPAIFIALCIFWPVGVYLIIKRVSLDKQTAMGAGKIIGGIGTASYAIAILGFIVCAGSGFESSDVTAMMFFGIAGYVLKRLSKKIKKDAEEVRKYLAIIVNGKQTNLDVIASSIGKNYEITKSDVQELINKGYLKNAYIDESSRMVVMANNTVNINTNTNANALNMGSVVSNTSGLGTQNLAPRVVTCKCCGANNMLSGTMGECEYCGSPIK